MVDNLSIYPIHLHSSIQDKTDTTLSDQRHPIIIKTRPFKQKIPRKDDLWKALKKCKEEQAAMRDSIIQKYNESSAQQTVD